MQWQNETVVQFWPMNLLRCHISKYNDFFCWGGLQPCSDCAEDQSFGARRMFLPVMPYMPSTPEWHEKILEDGGGLVPLLFPREWTLSCLITLSHFYKPFVHLLSQVFFGLVLSVCVSTDSLLISIVGETHPLHRTVLRWCLSADLLFSVLSNFFGKKSVKSKLLWRTTPA